MSQKGQTIFIAVDQGFAARYLLRTDIFRVLKNFCTRIVILSPNADEDYFSREFSNNNVSVETIRIEAYQKYARSRLQTFLRYVRWYVMNNKMDLHTIDMRYNIHRKTRQHETIIQGLYYFLLDILVNLLRRSKRLRRLEIQTETKMFTPKTHGDLFEKYRPDKMIVTSLGYFGFDHYLMREARKHGVKVISVILSWDNTTSKGMPGATADHVIAWTENMKNELAGYSDIDPHIIFVGGIAHFDHHYRKENHWTKEKLYSHFGLNPERKLLFFALRSPNNYPWNPDIVEFLAKAIKEDRFIYPCQILVRLHPLNFRVQNEELRFEEDTTRHLSLRDKYKNLFYDIPEILSKKLPIDMPISEMEKLSAILNHSDVMLTFFSTMMLEASIFNLPIINVALYAHHRSLEINDLQVTESPHIKRVIKTGGVRTVYRKEELIETINMYLKDREIDSFGRTTLKEQECSINPGIAGDTIGKYILEL
jgi:hypothetical protein